MSSALQKEFDYFLEQQDELVKEHRGKFVVIKNQRVLGVYDSELEAVVETSKSEKLGTFLVQKCEPGESSFSQTFHSRVSFG
jgi:hypothetical protein